MSLFMLGNFRRASSAVGASVLIALVLFVKPSASRAQAGARPRPLRVAYLSTSATMASVWMAKEAGAFVKEG